MESLEQYDEYLKARLSQKRYIHSKNVSEASVMLAKKFGGTDVETARFAGLVHDICKEAPVWHGIAGAELLRTKFGVTDEDVLHAVRFHTVGRAGMSNLEKIVYLADMISAERDYPDVDVMREKAAESLNATAGRMIIADEQKKLLR